MKLNKWKIRTTYEGVSEDEVLLPEGVEISAVYVKYGDLTIETVCGNEINMKGNQYVDWDNKRPSDITFFKEDK